MLDRADRERLRGMEARLEREDPTLAAQFALWASPDQPPEGRSVAAFLFGLVVVSTLVSLGRANEELTVVLGVLALFHAWLVWHLRPSHSHQ